MIDDAPIEELKAIAHPLRFQIIQLLRAGELNVGEIEQASGIGQPALSQQLGILRKADLVETRKSAKLVFYSLNTDRLAGYWHSCRRAGRVRKQTANHQTHLLLRRGKFRKAVLVRTRADARPSTAYSLPADGADQRNIEGSL